VLVIARRLPETLLIDVRWRAVASTVAMMVLSLLGVLMGLPRISNSLAGGTRRWASPSLARHRIEAARLCAGSADLIDAAGATGAVEPISRGMRSEARACHRVRARFKRRDFA